MKRTLSILLLVFVVGAAQAQSQGLAVSLRAGTMGPGVDVSVPIGKKMSLRAGGSLLSLSRTETQEDDDVSVEFKGDVTWGGFKGLLDFHPFANGFRLTGGVYLDVREVTAVGKPISSLDIDGKEFSPDRLGSLSAKLKYDQPISPYVGIGFGDATRGARVGFLLDLGVIYAGKPTFEMTGTGMMAPTANWAPTMEEGIETFTWMPVLSIGLAIRLL